MNAFLSEKSYSNNSVVELNGVIRKVKTVGKVEFIYVPSKGVFYWKVGNVAFKGIKAEREFCDLLGVDNLIKEVNKFSNLVRYTRIEAKITLFIVYLT